MLQRTVVYITALMLHIGLLAGCATTSDQTVKQYQPGVSHSTTDAAVVQPASVEAATPAQPAAASEEPEAYRIGPQDLLEINVFGVDELSGKVRVNIGGFISLPLVGQVEAAGLTSEELAKRIEEKLAENYLQDPHVSIFILEYTSQRVTVEGAVNKPGVYPIAGPTTLLQTMAMAQGLDKLSDPGDVKIFRTTEEGQKQVMTFDLRTIRDGRVKDPYIQGDDVVLVGESTGKAFAQTLIDFVMPFRLFRPYPLSGY